MRVMVVEERQKEKTGEEGGQQGRVLVCGKQHTHSACALPHTHRGKTRQDMGMVTHTHMGMDDMTHTRGKGREKTRGGTREDTQALLFSKMKKKGEKTMRSG